MYPIFGLKRGGKKRQNDLAGCAIKTHPFGNKNTSGKHPENVRKTSEKHPENWLGLYTIGDDGDATGVMGAVGIYHISYC